MTRDPATTDSLRRLVAQLLALTEEGALHWERQAGSAHRYASWKNNLLILGPDEPGSDTTVPRYLFITPFNSPSHIEINSNDEELGKLVLSLVAAVEDASEGKPPIDPFALSEDLLSRLVS